MEIGLIFALFSAITFSIGTILVRRGVSTAGESFTAVFISLSIGAVMVTLAMLYQGDWDKVMAFSWKGLALLAGAGTIHFLVGRFFNYASIRIIGANRSTALSRTNTLYAIIFGVVLLKESITLPVLLGIIGILTGVALVTLEKREPEVNPVAGSRASVLGVVSGLAAGLCWGISGVMIKIAMGEVSAPLAGTFISYIAATTLLAITLLGKQQRRQLTQLRRISIIPLFFAGILTAIAHLLRFAALDSSPVTVVQPLISTNVVFVLLFSFLANRRLEVFTWRVIG
ncbi:MAG: DMT family transporter, partial [Chloroflexota bacterium]